MDENRDTKISKLRSRAENILKKAIINGGELSSKESNRAFHELQTYQIELELQNEDLRRTQEELIRARDSYTDLYDFAPVGYMTINSKGLIVEVNLKLAKMLSVERSHLLNRPVTSFIYADDQDIYYKHSRKVHGSSLGVSCQIRMIRKNDDPFWCEINSLSIQNQEKNDIRTIVTDITGQKDLQAKLAQADRLSSLGLLAAGIAHEINNPLTYVMFHSEKLALELPQLLDGTSESGHSRVDQYEIKEFATNAKTVFDGVLRIRDIVKKLRIFSHMEVEKKAKLSIRKVLDAAIDIASNEFKYKAQLSKSYADLPDIIGNAGSLCQVFLNLLVNAAHAIDEGNKENSEIRVVTRQKGTNIVVEISDTGCGIPTHQIKQIFDPFFTSKKIGLGSGLGLFICQEITKAYGGHISVKSTLTKGSCFTIELPIEVPAKDTSKDTDEQSDIKISQSPVTKGRILIVDDEPDILEVVSIILKAYDVYTANSAQEAKELIQTQAPFDVIICDMMMPNMTGMDLYDWTIRIDPELATRFVFITGGAFTPRGKMFLQNVPNEYLIKPLMPDKLRNIVHKYIREEKALNSPDTNR